MVLYYNGQRNPARYHNVEMFWGKQWKQLPNSNVINPLRTRSFWVIHFDYESHRKSNGWWPQTAIFVGMWVIGKVTMSHETILVIPHTTSSVYILHEYAHVFVVFYAVRFKFEFLVHANDPFTHIFNVISLTPEQSYDHPITITSKWARWRLKSPASRLFTQPFIQA